MERQYSKETLEIISGVELTNREGRAVSAQIETKEGWATITPGKGEFELTVTRADRTDYQNEPDGGYSDAPHDETVFHETFETMNGVRETLQGEFGVELPDEVSNRLDEALEIEAGEDGALPSSYWPTSEELKRVGNFFTGLNPEVSVAEMVKITHHKVIKATPEALDRWAESRGLEVCYEAKWDNPRGCTIYESDPFRVVAYRDKETFRKVPGTFVTDRIHTSHLASSFRSTVESSFEAHDKYGKGLPKDDRHIKHVIDNSKQMEREAGREMPAIVERAITPQR